MLSIGENFQLNNYPAENEHEKQLGDFSVEQCDFQIFLLLVGYRPELVILKMYFAIA